MMKCFNGYTVRADESVENRTTKMKYIGAERIRNPTTDLAYSVSDFIVV